MFGSSGQGPISDGNGPGRLIAFAIAIALILGGAYFAWLAPNHGSAAGPVFAAPSPSPAGVPDPAISAAPLLRGAVPELRSSYVFDQADVLSDEAAAKLDAALGKLHTEAGPEVIVMTVPSLSGSAIDVYARKVANQWAFGDAVRKDGVLLMIAPNDRQVRIEVGTGLETTLSNAECKSIIDTRMLPLFRQGQTERATVAGTTEIARQLSAHPTLFAKQER